MDWRAECVPRAPTPASSVSRDGLETSRRLHVPAQRRNVFGNWCGCALVIEWRVSCDVFGSGVGDDAILMRTKIRCSFLLLLPL